MPRVARTVIPNVPHHVTQRGNNRQDVFFVDDDRREYLECLRRESERHGLEKVVPLAYECIMELYAAWWGDWNDFHESFTWQKLGVSCKRFGIDPGVEHSALDDARAALAVLRAMGEG